MAKKKFASPFVLFTLTPEDGPVIGNGSAHGYVSDEDHSQAKAWPMPYGLWLDEVGIDVDGSGGIPDWKDYEAWFKSNGLNTDLMEPRENPNP